MLICPTGSFLRLAVQFSCQKDFASRFARSSSRDETIPSQTRGVSRSSRTRDGVRWLRQRARRSAPAADGEVVWSWHLDADVKLRGSIRAMTVARKPDHRGEYEVSR